jgi:type VI secretion system secreted protein VgrG
MANTQTSRPLAVTTPLGPDKLLLVGFSGQEALSQLFTFFLDCMAENKTEVPFDKLLGQPIGVRLELPGGKQRFFAGICSRVSQGESTQTFTDYRLEVVPALWLLTRRAQSRIFQHKNVPDILKEVLKGLDVSYQIQGTFHPRDFCVQYRETDFNFASRLMEEEGLYYFFKHSEKGAQMVVANTPSGHPDLPTGAKVTYRNLTQGPALPEDLVYDWGKSQELAPGKYTLFDHCFELPHKHLEADKPMLDSVQVGGAAHKLKVGPNGPLEIYDWPGEYAQRFDGIDKGGGEQPAELQKIFEDNKRTVEIRMQEGASGSILVQGASTCRQFVSGHKFTVATLAADATTRPQKAEGAYVLTSVSHSARLGSDYRSGDWSGFDYTNSFSCIPAALPYRPARTTPKPVVPGSQTAVVVGPKGEEIFTDKYGRVKVQFHWDREGKSDADSSCWVRVATVWAGKQWGVVHIPRIGQEVVVDFLEGDPDQPIIVGSVFNADQMPGYKLPDEKTKSYMKTNSTLGGVGYNEVRFEDKKDKEQIFIHAERNMDTRVKNDCMERIIGNRHLIVGWEKDGKKGGDQREMVYQDKHLDVKRDQVEHIEGNMQLTVGKGEAENGGTVDIVIEKDRKELIEKNAHLHVKEARVEQVDKDQSLTVKGVLAETVGESHVHVKGPRSEKVEGVQSLTVGGDQHEKVGQNHALEAGMEIHIKAGMKLILEAGMQLSLKGPGGFIDIGPAGVAISGTMVLINSGGAAGSGSGAKPQAPKDAQAPEDAQEAKPTKPAVADDSQTGHKSAPG